MAEPAVLTPRAREDVDAIVDRLLTEAGTRVALDFADALEAALGLIGEHPAAGSERYASALAIPRLRHWPLARYPYVIFWFLPTSCGFTLVRPEHKM